MAERPTISVIMPCYNAGPWVRGALRSIAAQTRPPEQVIVIDDGSSDNSLEEIRSSGVELLLLQTRLKNAAAARNFGVERATGEWLAFLDADDEWYPQHLGEAEALIRRGHDAGVTGIDDYLFVDGQRRLTVNPWPIDEPTTGLSAERYVEFWSRQLKFTLIPTLVRRDRFLEVGGFDPEQKRRHDFDMWLRVIHGRTWAYNPRATAIARLTPGSIGRTNWASSEYFALRGMLKNLERYPVQMAPTVRRAAQRAVSASLTDGTREDFDRVRPIAWPHLSLRHRLVFSAAALAPGAFRALNRARRRRLFERRGIRTAEVPASS